MLVPQGVNMPHIKVTRVINEYPKAWCLELEFGSTWMLPKSKCPFDQQQMSVFIPQWLWDEKRKEDRNAIERKFKQRKEEDKVQS